MRGWAAGVALAGAEGSRAAEGLTAQIDQLPLPAFAIIVNPCVFPHLAQTFRPRLFAGRSFAGGWLRAGGCDYAAASPSIAHIVFGGEF